jgi:hypothetical protein
VREFAARGAKYFIAQNKIIALKPDFALEIKQDFRLAAECDEFLVFEHGL